jgi:hypothetical protein
MKQMSSNESPQSKRIGAEVALLVTALGVLAGYSLLRFGGLWGETDARTIAQTIQAMQEAGRLIPSSGPVYPNGYSYQALSVFILQTAGITTSQLQLYVHLFLMPWIALPAWLLYRELTGSRVGATLAAAILLAQPEFLFSLMRGTHEKFTRGLILLALYLFVKSLSENHNVRRMAGYILAFYLVLFGFVTLNNLLAFSLIAALVLALAILSVLRWWTRSHPGTVPATERRLRYAVLTAALIVYMFTFYFYPPARSNIYVINNMWERTASMLLDMERPAGPDPYAYTAGAWTSGQVYLVLSSSTWILLLVSLLIWLWQSLGLLTRRTQGWPPGRMMLWALYGAFAVQGALSILVDLSGALAANLQVRVFPAFSMLAAPVAATVFKNWQASPLQRHKLGWALTICAIAVMAGLSVLKATNEPLVSNKWHFYIPAEMRALDRAEGILEGRMIWIGFDDRLKVARTLQDPEIDYKINSTLRRFDTPNILVSDVIEARGARLYASPPREADSLLTYDNGQAQIYHLRPRTPFQR